MTPDLVDALGADLRAAGYTVDGVADLLGADAHAALGRGVWWPALRACDAAGGPLATLVRLFLLGAQETPERVAAAFPSAGLAALTAEGVLQDTGDTVRAILDIRPHSDGARDFLVVSDQDAAVRSGPVQPDQVLGIGGASMSLARAVVRTPARRALDLGTGCGIQALHLDAHCTEIVATDTNERALTLAAATARLNGMTWDLRRGSLFEPVSGERFDLIVSNPPFVVGVGSQDYIYRDSGMAGDALCRTIVEQIGDHLNPAVLPLSWPIGLSRARIGVPACRVGWPAPDCMPGWCSANWPTRSAMSRCGWPMPVRNPSRPRRGWCVAGLVRRTGRHRYRHGADRLARAPSRGRGGTDV